MQQNYYETQCDHETVATSQQGVVIVLDHHIRSTLLTNCYRTTSTKLKINSTIIVKDNIAISNEIIYHTNHNTKSIASAVPQLLYRGTRDGFSAMDFHSKCDDQGPTLTIIKSAEPYNQIFGGFTTKSWMLSTGRHISDDSAFLFKIDENNHFRKFNIIPDMKQKAIYTHTCYLPVFGGGHDIIISGRCNEGEYSSSNFGRTYELPSPQSNNEDEYQYQSERARKYLAGSYIFKVSEIEVFKIIRQ